MRDVKFYLLTQPRESLALPGEFAAATVDLSQVHWGQELALVADMGEQRTGGYAIALQELRPEPGGVQVVLQVHRPGPGAMVMQAITHPWCLVRIPAGELAEGSEVLVRDQHGHELARLQVRLGEEAAGEG